MSDSVRPHRWQPTRLFHPWDFLGKNTGMCCHFLLQCMKVKSESEVAQSCLTLSDSMDYSLPGFCIHGIFQARVLEWGAIVFSINISYHFLLACRVSAERSSVKQVRFPLYGTCCFSLLFLIFFLFLCVYSLLV